MKSTRQTKTAPVSPRKSIRILTGSVAALLTVAAASTAPAATLIRVDFGTSGGPGGYGGVPATGYVETKAATTDASFGSLGANSWVSLDEAGGSLIGTNMLNTDGSATTVDLSITGISNSSASAGDWRGNNANNNLWALSYDGIAGTASNNFTLSGLLPNTETKLWLYSIDRSMQTSGLTITGSTLTTGGQFDSNGNAGGWSTFIRTDANWNHSGGTPNWTADASQSVLNPNNGFGWMLTVTSDGSGTITGSTAFGGGENQTFSGLQIFQADPTLIWNAGADGNWSAATWTGSPPNFPDATRSARIDTGHTVTVDGAHFAQNLTTLNDGKILISAGNSLTLSGAISVAAVGAGSGVTMGANTTLAAQSGSIASLSAGGNVILNVTGGANSTLTVPAYAATAASTLTKGGTGKLALTNPTNSTDPLGASTTGIVLNGGTLSIDNSTIVTTNNALKASLYYNPYSPNPQLRFEQAGSILSQTPFQTASDTGLGTRNENGITYGGNNSQSSQNFNALFPGMTNFDHFQVAWTGFLTAPASGNYNLYGQDVDNAYSVYVDLNQDGVFTLNEERWEAGTGSGSNGAFALTAGQRYKVAFGFAEEGGDQGIRFHIDTPSGPGNFAVNPGAGNQAGWWSYDTTTYGALNMAGKSLTVAAASTLHLGTDQAVTFGALNANGGTATITGPVPSLSFTSTTVPGGITSGIAPASTVTVALGPVSIGAAGTLVVGGQATATSTSLTGSGGVQVSAGGKYNVGTYNDGAVARTFTAGGAGTTVLSNNTGTIVAADTTFRVTGGGTLDATNSGNNDPLGGSTSIQLAGGKLSLRGIVGLNPGAVTYDFESGDLTGWTGLTYSGGGTGDIFLNGHQPISDDVRIGNWGVNTWRQANPGGNSDAYTGIMETGSFTVNAGNHITFKLASAPYAFSGDPDAPNANMTAVTLEREVAPGNWEMVQTESHGTDWNFEDVDWDTTAYLGDTLRLRVYDTSTAGWGHIAVDNFLLSNINQVQVGPISMLTKNFTVDASSELNAQSASSAAFGALTFNNGVVTLSGSPAISFTGTTIALGATEVGISIGASVTANLGVINGSATAAPFTFVKAGAGNFTLNGGNVGMGNATFDVQAGKLTALSAAGLGGSTATKLSGGQLFLSSSGGDQAYDVSMDVTQSSTLTVGKDTVGGVNAPVNVTLGSAGKTLTVRNGKTLTVNATDSYTLDLNNSLAFEDSAVMTISGAGVDVNILGGSTLAMANGSTINLNAGVMKTDSATTVYNLNLNGGALQLNGVNPANRNLHVNGTLKVDSGSTNLSFTGGASLTTAGNATINLVNGTITTDSALSVGNLTVEAGGTLNRTGVGAAGNVSVGDKLRLVNKTFNTTGSTLSVGNRIELVNSTLAFNNNLSLGTVNMDNYSVFSPGAGTTTTLSGNLEMYNHSSANFTGATLAMTNRLDVRGYSTLTIANPLTLNGDLQFEDHAIVDFGSNVLTTNQDRELRINDGSELRVPNASNLNIRYLEIQGGKLTAGSVNIRDRIYFAGRDSRTNNNVHSFNITQESANRHITVVGDSIRRNPADGSTDIYLTGTNTYTGRTEVQNAVVLVANDGTGLPTLSKLYFQDGVLGASGTFTREIGNDDQTGKVYWENGGGFAAYGGNLTVSLKPQGGVVGGPLLWNSATQGFRSQLLYLGSTNATHDVTLTNNIEINTDAPIETWAFNHLATLSGDLTGGSTLDKRGPGTLVLAGTNGGFSGRQYIRRGALDVGLNGSHLGTGHIDLQADNADTYNKGAILQANGALNLTIGNGNGEVRWEDNGGGFAARSGALAVTLNGGATINWGDDPSGFRGRNLMFGSGTADSVVTLTNNINAQNGNRTIYVFDNPNSANDKAVLGGNITNLNEFTKRGDGVLETAGNAGVLSSSAEIRNYNGGTLKVIGDMRAGNEYVGGDPRYIGSSDQHIRNEDGASKLIVTGNVQGNFFQAGHDVNSNVNITGNLTLRERIEQNNGTVLIGGNLQQGDGNLHIRNGSNFTVNGNTRIGAPNGNSADRNVQIENGGSATFNGGLLTSEIHANNKNSNGRGSSVRINGVAMIGNTGGANINFNPQNPTSGGILDGSGTINANYVQFHNKGTLGGTLTLNIKDRIELHGSTSILAPGNSAGTLTVNGTLQLNGGSHYYFDAGDMVNVNVFAGSNTGSQLIANDGWTLNFKTGGSTFATGGSIELFHYTNLGSFDLTPNYNVADLITAGWIPNNFDTGTLSLTASGGVVTLFGLKRQPIIWTGGSSGPGDDNWTTGSNWATAATAGNVLTFAGNVRTSPNNDFAALSSFAGLEFDATAAAFTVGGNAIDLTGDIVNSSANTQTINLPIQLASVIPVNTGGQAMSIGGNLSGPGGLTKTGGGTLTLTGTNTQTGTTTIQQGVLAVGSAGTLGTTITSLKFTGGTLRTTAAITSDRPVEVAAGGGTVDTNGFTSTLSGALSGTGSLTKDGAGTLNLTGTSTNTAAMNVNGGTLRGNTDSLKGNVVLANSSNLAFNQTANGTYTKVVSGAGNLTKEGNAILTVQGSHTYDGGTIITDGTLKLEANPGFRYYRFQTNSGLSGGETQQSEIAFYSSGTNNINGTRVIPIAAIGDGGSYNDGPLTNLFDNNLGTKNFYNGLPRFVTFDFGTAFAASGYDWASANDATPGRNPHNWTVSGSNDNTNFTLLDTQTGQGNTPNTTFTWAPGWALNLGGGSGSDLLPIGTTVTMASNTTLDLNNVDQQVGALADAGGGPTGHQVLLAGTTLQIGNATIAETTFSGAIIGTGTDAVEKNGTSIQTLTGAQQYDTLTVSEGTLNVNGAVGITPANGTASVVVAAGAKLKFGSVSQTLSSLTIGAGSTVTFTSGVASGAFSGGGKAASFSSTAAVPEPGTLGLLLVGALGVLNRRRR